MTFKEWTRLLTTEHEEQINLLELINDWKTEREKLIGALVKAAIPLEALLSSIRWELAPEVSEEIAGAVREVRAVLAEAKEGG